ncbi:unnamed protein product, partial [Porites lobata]
MECLQAGRQRVVYLITYSRADVVKFPSKESFSNAVLQAWQNFGVRVVQWVTCIEAHHNTDNAETGQEMNLYHYHMAIKLEKRVRWFQVRKYLDENFGIKVNFSDNHTTYYSAYRYVTKEDKDALHSPCHPDLTDVPPQTESAVATKKRKAKAKQQRRKSKKRGGDRLSTFDVCQLVQAKSISSRLELVSLAAAQVREGKTALAEFIANRGSKAVDEAIQLAKEFAEAETRLNRSKKTRIELLEEELTGEGKYRNVYIHGPANCGKSFIVSPLKVIYQAFSNPATGSFAWIGAEEAEIIYLNDFRWHPKIIAWADFLQALEGDTVHLPAPKNLCSKDIELSKDTPFFATSDAPLVLVKRGAIDRVNTEMMSCRWVFFHFWKQIPHAEQEDIPRVDFASQNLF